MIGYYFGVDARRTRAVFGGGAKEVFNKKIARFRTARHSL
jgi:hypothetical protein